MSGSSGSMGTRIRPPHAVARQGDAPGRGTADLWRLGTKPPCQPRGRVRQPAGRLERGVVLGEGVTFALDGERDVLLFPLPQCPALRFEELALGAGS